MKKQTKINYILTLILVFCIGASIPVLTGSSQVTEQHRPLSGRSSRTVAVYARHRTGIRTGSERQRRRTLPH